MTASTGAPALTMIIAFRGPLESSDELLHRARRHNVLPLRFARGEFIGDFRRPVEHGHGKSLRFHVEDEVFAHDRETDQPDIALIRVHFKYLLGHAGIGDGILYPVPIAHGNFRL